MSIRIFEEISEVARRIDGDPARSAVAISALARGLDEAADARLGSPGGRDMRSGVMAKLTAIELGPAARALQTAARAADGGGAPRTVGVVLKLARKRLANAAALATELPDDLVPARVPDSGGADSPAAAGQAPETSVLQNIATYHREHERYYTWAQAQEAADLFREANRIKAVATTWLDDPAPPALRLSSGDFADPRFTAAGCNDLNAVRAISAIGVLFMEGEGEPVEIRVLKGKLRGLAPAWQASGRWLAEKMEHAWIRESVVLREDRSAASEQRFGAIMTNWCGSRQMQLAGRCAAIALAILDSKEWTPREVRGDRRGAGRQLLDAAWALDGAAQVFIRTALDLSDNERRWTSYLEFLAALEPEQGK